MAYEKRIVITGMGTVNPLGNDVAETWQAIVNGRSGIGPITQFDASGYGTQIAGEVKDFDPVAHFGRKDARRMARPTQLALAAAGEALAQAGLAQTNEARDRTGVIVGCGMGNLDPVVETLHIIEQSDPSRVNPFFIPMMLPDTPSAAISMRFGLRGLNMGVETACATGKNAIGEAAWNIVRGSADVMLAGGTDACIMPLGIAGFGKMRALSTRNDDPVGASRPFDRDRDGFVPAEGAAVLVLESLAHAQARGATIWGELLGYGASSDAFHVSQPAPDGNGAIRAILAAMNEAGVEAADIDYINAHGTSTPLNDAAETTALKKALGEHAYNIPVSSTKSMHGHMLGATGALEAILCLKAIADGLLPPTINLDNPDPECDLDYVPHVARPAGIDIAMSNAFGFGGHNATLILGRYHER